MRSKCRQCSGRHLRLTQGCRHAEPRWRTQSWCRAVGSLSDAIAPSTCRCGIGADARVNHTCSARSTCGPSRRGGPRLCARPWCDWMHGCTWVAVDTNSPETPSGSQDRGRRSDGETAAGTDGATRGIRIRVQRRAIVVLPAHAEAQPSRIELPRLCFTGSVPATRSRIPAAQRTPHGRSRSHCNPPETRFHYTAPLPRCDVLCANKVERNTLTSANHGLLTEGDLVLVAEEGSIS